MVTQGSRVVLVSRSPALGFLGRDGCCIHLLRASPRKIPLLPPPPPRLSDLHYSIRLILQQALGVRFSLLQGLHLWWAAQCSPVVPGLAQPQHPKGRSLRTKWSDMHIFDSLRLQDLEQRYFMMELQL